MNNVLTFPSRQHPKSGRFFPVRLADGLWWIDHESRGGASFGIQSDFGPYKLEGEAQQVANQLNAIVWQALQAQTPPEGDGA
ncbi:hypothetical protein GGR25_002257 [Kaistia hirudinis]|uniref:Uncharacterized protein n=1 Tax=Kaistia hirudinis TaxID=1293440 RepID=A0A840AQ78_9HYPH|nr:hypothetical protein [Kaistia hirudinis]MBB3931207.1 hypothetical protein [Kaistia hirudinis]